MRRRTTKARRCGCRISFIHRKRGGPGRGQPALTCPGSPFPRFISKEDLAKYEAMAKESKSICSDVLVRNKDK